MISKDKLDESIKKIDKQLFKQLINSMNEQALFSYFALLDKETKQTILNLKPLIWKLINKYNSNRENKKEIKINDTNREYILLCLCIHIAKYISSKSFPRIIDKSNLEHVGYKEGLIKHNIYIVEDLLIEYSKACRKYNWSEIQQEFFKRLDKKQLRGSDKLKKDCTKIMTTVYFRTLSLKYVFSNDNNLQSFLKKKDLNKFIEDNILQMSAEQKELDFLLNNDVFNSYKPNL